jgi:hypothetical protein
MPGLVRGIQYAAASRFYFRRLWNTGAPGLNIKPGDDDAGNEKGGLKARRFDEKC